MMEAIVKALFNITDEVMDRVWTRMTEGFFSAFLVILIGTPVLANWGGSWVILFLMISFFVAWLVVTLRLRNIIFVAGGGILVGIPLEGDAAKISKDVLAKFFKAVFLVLIWAEVYMAVYFHLPSLAKEAWMVGSAIALMLVITPLAIYLVSTGKIADGPSWHRPVITGCVFFMVLIALSAIPSIPATVWTGLGVNPIAFTTPETSNTAQMLRDQSYKNLVAKKNIELQKLNAKVMKGEVLSQNELEEIRILEQEVVNSVPTIPTNRISSTIKNAGGEYAVFVVGIILVVALFMIFGRRQFGSASTVSASKTVSVKAKSSSKPFSWFWLIVWLIVGWVVYTNWDSIEDWLRDTKQETAQVVSSIANPTVKIPYRDFMLKSELGYMGARKIADDPDAQNMEQIYLISRGSHSGNRENFGFGWINDGTAVTLIIQQDRDNEMQDLIVSLKEPQDSEFSDGSWGYITSWHSRGNNKIRGTAYLVFKDHNRYITLVLDDGKKYGSYVLEKL